MVIWICSPSRSSRNAPSATISPGQSAKVGERLDGSKFRPEMFKRADNVGCQLTRPEIRVSLPAVSSRNASRVKPCGLPTPLSRSSTGLNSAGSTAVWACSRTASTGPLAVMAPDCKRSWTSPRAASNGHASVSQAIRASIRSRWTVAWAWSVAGRPRESRSALSDASKAAR